MQTLQKATNEAIDAAQARKSRMGGAVNWGDLRCAGVAWQVDQDGKPSYRVEIEEAAPEAVEFRRFVEACLADAGFSHVEVVMEW